MSLWIILSVFSFAMVDGLKLSTRTITPSTAHDTSHRQFTMYFIGGAAKPHMGLWPPYVTVDFMSNGNDELRHLKNKLEREAPNLGIAIGTAMVPSSWKGVCTRIKVDDNNSRAMRKQKVEKVQNCTSNTIEELYEQASKSKSNSVLYISSSEWFGVLSEKHATKHVINEQYALIEKCKNYRQLGKGNIIKVTLSLLEERVAPLLKKKETWRMTQLEYVHGLSNDESKDPITVAPVPPVAMEKNGDEQGPKPNQPQVEGDVHQALAVDSTRIRERVGRAQAFLQRKRSFSLTTGGDIHQALAVDPARIRERVERARVFLHERKQSFSSLTANTSKI